MSGPLEFVFSFRSPYAWIAARHILPMLPPEQEVRWLPFFPLPPFSNFGRLIPEKVRYNIEDLLRLTKAYGLRIARPAPGDPDWSISHAAFLHADGEGKGAEFGQALIEARWGRGQDVASEQVIGDTAESVGLDPKGVLAASQNEQLRSKLTARIERDYTERGIFGVPMFITAEGARFWGHDRMEWGLRQGLVR